MAGEGVARRKLRRCFEHSTCRRAEKTDLTSCSRRCTAFGDRPCSWYLAFARLSLYAAKHLPLDCKTSLNRGHILLRTMPQSLSTEFDDDIAVATNRRHSPPVHRNTGDSFCFSFDRPSATPVASSFVSAIREHFCGIVAASHCASAVVERPCWGREHTTDDAYLSQCVRQEVMLTMMRVFSFSYALLSLQLSS